MRVYMYTVLAKTENPVKRRKLIIASYLMSFVGILIAVTLGVTFGVRHSRSQSSYVNTQKQVSFLCYWLYKNIIANGVRVCRVCIVNFFANLFWAIVLLDSEGMWKAVPYGWSSMIDTLREMLVVAVRAFCASRSSVSSDRRLRADTWDFMKGAKGNVAIQIRVSWKLTLQPYSGSLKWL